MLEFIPLDKSKFPCHARDIFAILAGNMAQIAPTGNAYEDDYNAWCGAVSAGLREESRQIILIYAQNELAGFFQYFASCGLFMMEEIQLAPRYQGEFNIFRALYGYVFSILPDNIQYVEAYASKLNHKSQSILERLGLKNIGENKNRKSFHYRGSYADLMKWYNSI